MCLGLFGGRSDEYLVWVYGDDDLASYNGVTVIGNRIPSYCVEEKNGLRFTNFNRTLNDALANESILDMQGITEALSRFCDSNEGCIRNLIVSPGHQEQFERLVREALNYYGS